MLMQTISIRTTHLRRQSVSSLPQPRWTAMKAPTYAPLTQSEQNHQVPIAGGYRVDELRTSCHLGHECPGFAAYTLRGQDQ